MNFGVRAGKLLKDRENPDVDEAIIGEIVAVNPIIVSILKGQAILTQGVNCYVCESLISVGGDIKIDNIPEHGAIESRFIISRILNKGDKVMCVPTAKGDKYFIVDKVV